MLLYIRKLFWLLAFCLTSFASFAHSMDAEASLVLLDQRQRAQLSDAILQKRVKQLLPKLMRDTNIDMWIVMGREYNEDPILSTMLPSDWFSARRRTVLAFIDLGKQDGVKSYVIADYDMGDVFERGWDKSKHTSQMAALNALIAQYQPQRIGINTSQHFGLADGLSATDKQLLVKSLAPAVAERLVSAEPLAVAWLETRIDEEVAILRQLSKLTKRVIKTGFSNQVITAGETTLGDLVWWFRQQASELHLTTWFQPAIRLQRKNLPTNISQQADLVIMPGDLLHVDFGLSYLGMHSDIQQHAYVLTENEQTAPEFLQQALLRANRLQDVLVEQFALNRTGNDILARSRKQALSAGLQPKIYSHPIGYHGHGAGMNIGRWDAQHGLEGIGEHRLVHNSAYAIELSNTSYAAPWQKPVVIMLEENAIFTEQGVDYLAARQTQLILIKPRL
ncbi:M24 family metallopeptidase [Thalassotalea ponticola]|uniref:M24 family metallopeptidase n=1 Tax=Thalassotalea ponticola TaxID=1523392 RepID=UPI0025B5D3E5|nr:M24 family metallopeptidase [Thalassotalea ponticola]MDN3653867.1 M24 family metallopeptidase [Thalassotalea ponticola]